MDRERIEKRIAELEAQRDQYDAEAKAVYQQTIGQFMGAIAELRMMLEQADETEDEAAGE